MPRKCLMIGVVLSVLQEVVEFNGRLRLLDLNFCLSALSPT
jgi:hypothetical protein